ncbi:MAG: DUF3810 domain-containing protein [Butyrivibrio sp.]|nr:DUF3810 domain-containing protein [Butyrivibrio sp.]
MDLNKDLKKPKRKTTLIKPGVAAVLLLFSALFNAAAWFVPGFSDLFTDNVFVHISRIYGSLTSLAPFSVGEIMLIIGVLLIPAAIILAVLKKPQFLRALPLIIAIVVTVMSLNCFVLYHCSPIPCGTSEGKEYNLEDLTILRDYIVKKCNEMAEEIPHDEQGNVIYDGDMKAQAKKAVAGLSSQYKRLGGFNVTPKALTFSGFMSQQYMQGYYFPFSMEANYNDEMSIMNKPFTMCHELTHTHGYIYEDEANFLGFLACINSDDPVFRYSGYLGVLNYVNNDFYDAVDEETYKAHVRISDQVRYDNLFLTDEAWERVEDNAILDTETVKKAADTFIDTNLKVNGVSEGKVSYGKVVDHLLYYYDNHPYN